MKKIVLLPLVLFMIGLLLACASRAIPAEKSPSVEPGTKETQVTSKEEWQVEWEKTLTTARKEGRVVVFSPIGTAERQAISDSFTKDTNITVEFIAGRSAELTAKLLTERRAGIYNADLYFGGVSTQLTVLKPASVFEDMKPELILPEVTDPQMWFQKKLPFIDRDEKFVLAFRASPGGKTSILINKNLVNRETLASYFDLVKPEWKGKILLNDPATEGKGRLWLFRPLYFGLLDVDFIKALAKNEPVLIRDNRLQVEWTARGKYPVAIAFDEIIMLEFTQLGMPLDAFRPREEKPYLTAGFGGISLIGKSPHPAARKIFLNWLLSKKGQTVFSMSNLSQSARVDVPSDHLDQDSRREPGVEYFISDTEDFHMKSMEFNPVVLEIFRNASQR